MKIFISYARANQSKVKELQKLLEKAGHLAWFDQKIDAGDDWWISILASIKTCDVFVFALSPQATASEACRAELKYALQLNKPVLPIMLAEAELPIGKLRSIQYIIAKNLKNTDTILKINRALTKINERIKNGEFPPPELFPSDPEFPFPPDPLQEIRPRASHLDELPEEELLLIVYKLQEVSHHNQHSASEAKTLLEQIANDVRLPHGVVQIAKTILENMPSPSTRTQDSVKVRKIALTALAIMMPLFLIGAGIIIVNTITSDDGDSAVATDDNQVQNPNDDPDPAIAQWEPIVTTVGGIQRVQVPAGSFTMGIAPEQINVAIDLCRQAANDAIECQIQPYEREVATSDNTKVFSQPYWIDRTEVSRAQYQQCVEAAVCEPTLESDYSVGPLQPINRVSWLQAKTYCEWRNGRLPTEAEWEYAARGPSGWTFPWGNTFDGTLANHCDVNCGTGAWADPNAIHEEHDDGHAITAPVGSYPDGASWVGAFDMSGNLWEWTDSLYAPYSNNISNTTERIDRVLRGGSFGNGADALRTTHRFIDFELADNSFYGFRCVFDSEPGS